MNKSKLIKTFQTLAQDSDERLQRSITAGQPDYTNFEVWKTACLDAIELVFGSNSRNLLEFNSIRYVPSSQNPPDGLFQLNFILGLSMASSKLKGMLFTIESFMPDDDLPKLPNTLNPTIFIAHGGKTKKPLAKLKEFLLALGAGVVDVDQLPNVNLSVNDKVHAYMSLCNCAIAVITAEDQLKSGEQRGRPNVDYELGMLRKSENIGGKIIILKEKKVNLPSDYKEKVYVSFTRSAIPETFTRIVQELKAFGFFA